MDSIQEKIRSYIVENFLFGDDKGLENSTSFLEAGIVDSTGILEVISFLETSFGVKVLDSELLPENLDSIENIAGFVVRKSGSA